MYVFFLSFNKLNRQTSPYFRYTLLRFAKQLNFLRIAVELDGSMNYSEFNSVIVVFVGDM